MGICVSQDSTNASKASQGIFHGHEIQVNPEDDFDYLCLHLCPPDKIFIIHGDSLCGAIVRTAILRVWSVGIHTESVKYGVHLLKLHGRPLTPGHSLSSCRVVIGEIVSCLYAKGWLLVTSSDLSLYGNLTSLFFRKAFEPIVENLQSFIVALVGADRLHLLFGQENVVHATTTVLRESFHLKEEHLLEKGVEYVLKGKPWAHEEDSMSGHILIMLLIKQYAQLGYRYYQSIGSLEQGSDTLVFINDKLNRTALDANYMTISMSRTNRLRVTGADEQVHHFLRALIDQYWAPKLELEGPFHEGYEFKLKDNPWMGLHDEADSDAKRLIAVIFEDLLSLGWTLHATIKMSCQDSATSTFVMRSSASGQAAHVLALFPSGQNFLKVTRAPHEILQAIATLLNRKWTYGSIGYEESGGASIFRLGLNPWAADAQAQLHSCSIMCHILRALDQENWKFLSSADLSAYASTSHDGQVDSRGLHSWYFIKYDNDSIMG